MGGVWGAYWSLAVEEQFYLVWPIIVLLSSEKAIASICYIGLALALPLRFFLYYHYFGDNFGLAQITSSRVDGLFIGAACAVFMFRHKRPVPLRWIVGSAIGGVIILGYIALFHRGELVATGKWMTTVGISGFALISGALVALSQHRIPFLQRVLTFNLLRTAGKYSYGIYVYHLFSFLLIRRYLESKVGLSIHLNFPERILLLLVAFVIVFLAAKLSYDLFESRFLALKRYFNPAQATGSLKM